MRNLNIKKISVKAEKIPFHSLNEAFKPTLTGSAPDDVLKEIDITRNIGIFEDEMVQSSLADLAKVEIKLEGALPESNFVNIRVNGQLLVGTIFNEKEQKITGYVKRAPAPEEKANIQVEYPDGEKSEVSLNIEK